MTGRFRNLAIRNLALLAIAASACGGKDSHEDNQVFFVGYAYDGATGTRLDKTMLNDVSILYGDKTILFDIADDGRFTSKTALPTWRDYTVKIDATGYRSFASYNTGIDVPASLAMTNGVAQAETVQTLDFSAYLFPVSLKAPKLTLTITVPDSMTGGPVTDMVNGQLRLRPQSTSAILIGGSSTTTPAKRIWANSEDLLTQTIETSFSNGSATIEEGAMVYGVAYQLTVFGVEGYQPLDFTGTSGTSSTNPPIVAGTVTSASFMLSPVAQDPLKIVAFDGASCVPPSPTSNVYGGKLTLTFNFDVEPVGSTIAEDIDNGLSITVPSSSSTTYCTLRSASGDPSQERGSKVEFAGNTMTFSFNPTLGISTTSSFGGTCTLPPSITGITYYQGTPTIYLQPKGQPLRKRSLYTMLSEKVSTSYIACPLRTNF
jgi:hypothetical protein